MGSMSLMHWVIVLGIALLLFGGRGKLSSVMKDAAEGIKGFRKGLADDDSPPPVVEDGKTIEVQAKEQDRSLISALYILRH